MHFHHCLGGDIWTYLQQTKKIYTFFLLIQNICPEKHPQSTKALYLVTLGYFLARYIIFFLQAATRLEAWEGIYQQLLPAGTRCDLQCIRLYIADITIQQVLLISSSNLFTQLC